MPQYNEDFYSKPVGNTRTNEENIPTKIKHKIKISTLSLLFNTLIEVLVRIINKKTK